MQNQQKRFFFTILLLLAILVINACSMKDNHFTPVKIALHENWQFRQSGQDNWLPATVPGTVHNDLMDNKIIEDPFWRTNEKDVKWVEEKDWEYRTRFIVSKDVLDASNVDMIFEGLDTYADVYLNENLIWKNDNMFLGKTLNVKEYLTEGENLLKIYFHSPVNTGMKKLKSLDYLIPSTNELAKEGERTSVFTRKAPFHYGWDWGPRLVTSGIWRPVRLSAWNNARIEDIYLETKSIETDKAFIKADIEIIADKKGEYEIIATSDGKQVTEKPLKHFLNKGKNSIALELMIEKPELWWTNGLGDQYLYNFDFQIREGTNTVDSKTLDYGIRTIELVQKPDSAGHTFQFEINGIPVFMKGANVIPSETLTPSVAEETYRKMIKSAKDAHMNMLRVWGGAIYEEDLFYELCDQEGILVWQDFMFACNLQPGDEEHLENIKKEAEYNVKRLRNHTSLALWCGNNENLHGWHHWGWQDLYNEEQKAFMWKTYEKIFYEILPETVAKYDPKNEYWSSSPSSVGNQLADRKSGDEHDWTIWFGQKPFSDFNENIPRFVSEWGLQSFPSMHTIREYTMEEDRNLDSEVLRYRQRSKMDWVEPGFDGNDMIKFYMGKYFTIPEDFEQFVYVGQLLHALGYKTAIESHRKAMPHCMGTLYWQLNDCWPTTSWSTVDYFYRWKASHYAVRDAFKPIITASDQKDGKINIFAVSDLMKNTSASLDINLMDFEGNILFSEKHQTMIPSNNSQIIFEEDIDNLVGENLKNQVLLHFKLQNNSELLAENIHYFTYPKNLALTAANINHKLSMKNGEYLLKVSSDKLVKGLYIDTPDPDAVFSNNYFDLLPGQEKTITIRSDKTFNLQEAISLFHLQQTL